MNLRLIIASSLSLSLIHPVVAQDAAQPPAENERVLRTAPDSPRETEDPQGATVAEDETVSSNEDTSLADETVPAEGEAVVDEEAPGDEETVGDEEEFTFAVPDADPEERVSQGDDSTISVDFPDEEIRTILRIVADLYDLNLVVPDTLTGRASIKLRNVSWRQVFDVVLSPVGYTYVEEGGIIKVISLENLHMEPPVTEVTILNYARAEEILPTLQPLVNSETGGRIQIDRRSNALVITERPTQMRRIQEIITRLDQATIQVMIESKFIETRNRDLKNLGVNWASLDGYGLQAGPFNQTYRRERTTDRTVNRSEQNIDVAHQQEGFGRAGQLIGDTVGPPSTVRANPDGTTERVFEDIGPSSFDSRTTGSLASSIGTAVFSADQFNVILSALRTTNDVKLVSNPTVVTLNNTQANIHIGQEYPVVTPRYNPQTGTYEAGGSPEITRIGITLDVTPQVNAAGFINLDVEPEVSTLGDTVSYFGAEYPIKVTRRAHSNVTIRDGFTLAIGGLVQDDTINVERKVPVLGSIPGIGRLFRSESKDNDRRNLIIFLTARTLSPDGSTYEEIVDPRVARSMGLQREEIPGYRPDIEMFPNDPRPAAPVAEPAVVPPPVADPDATWEFSPDSSTPSAPGEEAGLAPAESDATEQAEEQELDSEIERLDAEESDLPGAEEVPPAPAPEPSRPSRWLTPGS